MTSAVSLENQCLFHILRFSSVLTGRQLFAKENNAIINTTAKQRVATLDTTVWPPSIKERWDALVDADKLE
ncbi:hypothetical protein B0H13DRAFT_2300661 [Mycena leptocephala]|nr:hypothetical protein B0H13DRAFT_2300661 [Mycena leptocephala]